jgi:hypothetical protein
MNNRGHGLVYAEDPEDQIAEGIFEPTWQSLRSVQCREWFRDAKLGFWAHWRPQAVPMYGDWYTRNMYIPPNLDSRTFARYGRQRSSTPNTSAKTIPYDCFTSGCTAIETHNQRRRVFHHLSCHFLRPDQHALPFPVWFRLVQVRN